MLPKPFFTENGSSWYSVTWLLRHFYRRTKRIAFSESANDTCGYNLIWIFYNSPMTTFKKRLSV